MKIIVGISGACGRVDFLEFGSGGRPETGKPSACIQPPSDFSYSLEDISSPPVRDGGPFDPLVIAPCSIHTIPAITHVIQSRSKLIPIVRKSPWYPGHLKTTPRAGGNEDRYCANNRGFFHHLERIMRVVEPGVCGWNGGAR